MSCINPRIAYKKTNGQFTLKKIGDDAPIANSVLVPCQQCMNCRINYQRQWATRMVHESKMHEQSSFLTLTINDENRRPDHSLDQRQMQLFLKRLRKSLQPKKISYFYCAEYGENTKREHYHAVIFGYMPSDRKQVSRNKQGDPLYQSESLNALWKMGNVIIGNFTPTTADYCSKYVTKAYIGNNKEDAYSWVNDQGEVIKREPPFQRASKRPALGFSFYDKYKTDMYPHDQVIIEGKPRSVPKAYDRKFRKEDPDAFQLIKRNRSDQLTKNLNQDPYQKTKQFRIAQTTILEQNLKLKPREPK